MATSKKTSTTSTRSKSTGPTRKTRSTAAKTTTRATASKATSTRTTAKTATRSTASKTATPRSTAATRPATGSKAPKIAAVTAPEPGQAAPAPAPAASAPPAEVTRKALIERVKARAEDTKGRDIRAVMDAVLQELGDALTAGETVKIPPLGVIKVQRRREIADGEIVICKLRRRKAAPAPKDPLAEAAE